MRISFAFVLCDISGNPITDSASGKDITLGQVAANALLAQFAGDDETAAPKLARYSLAKRIVSAKESLSLTVEDIALLKDRIAKGYGALVLGACVEILDPDALPK